MKKRIISVMLALILVMAVTYMPFLSEPSAYAEAEEEVSEKVVELPDAEQKANKAKAVAQVEDKLGIVEEPEAEEEAKEAEAEDLQGNELPGIKVSTGFEKKVKGLSLQAPIVNETFITVSNPNKSGVVTITGDLSEYAAYGFSFNSIYMDDQKVEFDNDINGWVQFTATIQMKSYDVGYHTIYFYYNDKDGNVLVDDDGNYVAGVATYVPTYIYKKASNSINWYQTGKKYIAAYYGKSTYYDSGYNTEYLDVYMDYKKKGGKWSKKVYGPLGTSSYNLKKKSGLRPNTTYYVRMMYGKKFTYNGKSYVFSGRNTGKASSAKKIMTAYKKPKVKKITIKGKNRVRKYKVLYAWRIRYIKSTGRIISRTPLYHTYRYYYATYKVNVYFKKKQNIAGVQVWTRDGTTQKNGNRKKYTVKYSVSGKRKGKKLTVKVKSFRSKKYLGFSGWTKKKVKVR